MDSFIEAAAVKAVWHILILWIFLLYENRTWLLVGTFSPNSSMEYRAEVLGKPYRGGASGIVEIVVDHVTYLWTVYPKNDFPVEGIIFKSVENIPRTCCFLLSAVWWWLLSTMKRDLRQGYMPLMRDVVWIRNMLKNGVTTDIMGRRDGLHFLRVVNCSTGTWSMSL